MFENDKTGENFNLNTFLNARKKCIEITNTIISRITGGLSEDEIKKIVQEEFAKIGVTKFWHPIKIRIGSDTTKSFRELSNLDLRTVNGQICFLDLGPIIDNHEADYGKTFIVGSIQSDELIQACDQVFKETSDVWKSNGTTGIELLNFASQAAEKLGYELNPLMAGHRLGDFPHKLFSSDKLFELNRRPTENLWILEIHLIDKKNNRGAFFEDLLI